MDNNNPEYRPGEPTVSKLRFYSIGVVAANKKLSSVTIEVVPIEELPMLDGFLTDNQKLSKAAGVDSSGRHYASKVKTSVSIQAEWLRLGDANRLTAPDVRRGESVVIYQFGDADKYYWNTLKNDSRLRKLETVVWGISASTSESEGLNANNAYYIEFSSHTKMITLHTSQSNGEACGYDIQINAADGYVLIKDTLSNYFKLDSRGQSLRLENAVGSFLDVSKGIVNMKGVETVNLDSPAINLNGGDIKLSGSSIALVSGSISLG